MTNHLTIEQQSRLDQLAAKAETGEQWAEIARLEAEMLALNELPTPAGILASAGFIREAPLADGTQVFSLASEETGV